MTSIVETLDHAVKNSFNVLLIGKHGVGKTAIVKEVFERHNLKWQYFSASTIDPWVDLIGVPKEKSDDKGNSYLELVRPRSIAFDDIEAIFLDEYNRAPKKVRNAVMELIQFGSINGKKLGKLKVVWAAINPDDEESTYDVEKLDPAQMDRFQLQIAVDYKPDRDYFKTKYSGMGITAIKWWNDQNEKVKNLISPRRLDYALAMVRAGGDVRYVLRGQEISVTSFLDAVQRGDPIEILNKLSEDTPDNIKKYLQDHNQLNHIKTDLLGKERYLKSLAQYLPAEELLKHLRPKQQGSALITHVESNPDKFEFLMQSILQNAQSYNARIVTAMQKYNTTKSKMPTMTTNKTTGSTVVTTVNGKREDIKNMNVCFTGALEGFTREQAQNLIQQYGGRISPTPTFGVTHVVVGSKAGTKLDKAKEQGCVILSEADFVRIIEELNTTK